MIGKLLRDVHYLVASIKYKMHVKEYLRCPGDCGDPDDRVEQVATLLQRIRDVNGDKKNKNFNAPLHGFMGTMDAVLGAFGAPTEFIQSWLTHFCLLIKYEDDDNIYL